MQKRPESGRTVWHLDIDAFFAAVEQRDDPRLRGQPVAVGTGVVASCSYEARSYGVRTAMRLTEARQRCPELIVVPGEYPRYEQTARRLLAVCCEWTPLVESAALDDVYLDVSGQVAVGSAAARQMVRALTEQVQAETQMTLSIGVGCNKLVAAVATKDVKKRKEHAWQTRQDKEGEIWHMPSVQVPEGSEREYLAPWPVRVLPGVGSRTEARLGRLNVRRVGELAAVPRAWLRRLFGTLGVQLHDYARGHDERPVTSEQRPQRIGRRTSFDPPTGELPFVLAMLDYLVDRAAAWMRLQGLGARGLTLTLRYGDYRTTSGREHWSRAVQSSDVLKEAARERFCRLYTRRLPLRLLGVELAPVVPVAVQRLLFADACAQRADELEHCRDAIRRRFGFLSLVSGTELALFQRLAHDRDRLRLRTPCLTR